jgi:ribose transport system ATP-binding protein
MTREELVTEDTTTIAVEPTMVLSGISKHYDGVAALTDVSLDIRPGQVHALLGENGAGKSTLMGVASGTTTPDGGTITVQGRVVDRLTPREAASLGVAIVHQHPVALPDLTVAENLRLAVPAQFLNNGSQQAAMRRLLEDVGSTAHLDDRVGSLSIAQRHLLELATALAQSPSLLILDEPTAPLGPESVDLLFARVRRAAEQGTAVVYITHRLAEVRELAQRVTVLRDGKLRGSADVDAISDEQLLALIVGRELTSTFPPKHVTESGEDPLLVVESLSGPGFSDVSLTARRGEIVGVSGIVGNGQSALLRALAGLEPFTGTVAIGSEGLGQRALRDRAAYLPADRHTEGLMMSLSVRENVAVAALKRFASGPFLSRRTENVAVGQELSALAVKTPSSEAVVSALSGGNQQKVVLARALLSAPSLVVADEPTQGVDVGARAEIYRILREVSSNGVPVVVASSDAKELEGLCDRVVVMSRGAAVDVVEGEAVTEERLIHSAVRATGHARQDAPKKAVGASTRLSRFLQGDYAPVLVLALVMLALGAYVYAKNERYLSAFNTTSVMTSCAALGFIALGQTIALLTGGIDLSVGPLAGFLVVIGSFFLNADKSIGMMVLGVGLMALAAAAAGAVNGSLIRFARFTPVAATLAGYIALQGLSFLLRDAPGGNISIDVTGVIKARVGPVPLVFVLFVLVTFAMEYLLRYSRWGLRVRAVGSKDESAHMLGVNVDRTVVLGYVAASMFVFLGSIVLLAQLGIGDPAQGVGYTLSSITAVVLGGTSLLGGRGTFVGTLLGAGLIVQVLNATVFLSLTQEWQYFFQGGLIVAAAVVYSQVRGTRPA